MKLESILNSVGLGLLAAALAVSSVTVARTSWQHLSDDSPETAGTTICFAHYQLESGLREAFQELSDEYMRLHPGVRVEQMAIPEKVFPNWMLTQLIGGTAPDIIELGMGSSDEILARYFVPLTSSLREPNPYNAGGPLAGVPWRDTFIDGLNGGISYNAQLLQYYSVTNTVNTVRIYYNKDLLRRIAGREDATPGTYAELLALCDRAAGARTPAGAPILPIAGSQVNAGYLLQGLFASQTQKLVFELAAPGTITANGDEVAFGLLEGRWSLQHPAVRGGLELVHEVGQRMTPGFLSLAREDALFQFCQGRALLIASGSWDAPSIRSQVPFQVGVFVIPLPAKEDQRYGENVLGPVSESNSSSYLGFGMTQPAAENARAAEARAARVIDFLQFLTARESNRRFSESSGWLPCISGVEPPPAAKPFAPVQTGWPGGFSMALGGVDGGSIGPETQRVVDTRLYQLVGAGGSAQKLIEDLAGPLRESVAADLRLNDRNRLRNLQRQDTTLAACRALAGAGETEFGSKAAELAESQAQQQLIQYEQRWRLRRLGIVPTAP